MSIFSDVPVTKISRSTHNLSHQVKASFDPGKLCPLMTELARPGDTWRVSMEQMVRTMPMLAPVMDMVDIKIDAFFCPIRLIWDDFDDFITLGLTGEFEATPPTISRVDTTLIADSDVALFNSITGVGGLGDLRIQNSLYGNTVYDGMYVRHRKDRFGNQEFVNPGTISSDFWSKYSRAYRSQLMNNMMRPALQNAADYGQFLDYLGNPIMDSYFGVPYMRSRNAMSALNYRLTNELGNAGTYGKLALSFFGLLK